MNLDEYRSFKYLVDTYLETRDEKSLKKIRQIIETKKSIRREFTKELHENERYIEIFSTEDQIKIGINILRRESHRKYSTFIAVWILFYMHKKAVNEIFKNIDSKAVNDVVFEIKNILKNDYWTHDKHYKPGTNRKFSRIGERLALIQLYRRCKKFE